MDAFEQISQSASQQADAVLSGDAQLLEDAAARLRARRGRASSFARAAAGLADLAAGFFRKVAVSPRRQDEELPDLLDDKHPPDLLG